MSRILVVEDDAAILRGLRDNLAAESYEVITAADGAEGYRLSQEKKPDLIILDLMLPKLSGYEICRKLRAEGNRVPILMLTARGDEADRVLGLDLGADDYVSKPFSVRELLARVRALLRRSEPQNASVDQLTFGDVVVDFLQYEARKKGQPVEMTPKEFGVLRYLAARRGQGRPAAGAARGGVGLRELPDDADGGQPHRVAAGQARGRSGGAPASAHGARRGIQVRVVSAHG